MRWASWGTGSYILAKSNTSLTRCYVVSQGEQKQEPGNDRLQRAREKGQLITPERKRETENGGTKG